MKTQRWIWWAVGGGVAAVLSLIVALAVLLGGPEGGGGLREDGLVVELEQIEKEGGVAGIKFSVHNPSDTKIVRVYENLHSDSFGFYLRAQDEHGNKYAISERLANPLLNMGIGFIGPRQKGEILLPIVLPVKAASRLDIELGPLVANSSATRRFHVKIKNTDATKGILYAKPKT